MVTTPRPVAARLPTGTVTLLFTDMQGSTRLLQADPAGYPALLNRHLRLLRAELGSGVEFGTEGDAFFAAFATPADAVSAAVWAQRRLAAEPWPDGRPVRVRMGVSTGPLETVGDGYVGLELHRAARICSAAHGGQVLVGSSTAAMCGELAPAIELRELGTYSLRDFDRPEPLFQAVADGLDDRFPPPRTAQARTVNLPAERTELFGRDSDLGLLQRLVQESRLVTVTGPGGAGKSRTAVRVAWNVAPLIADSVAFVPLAVTRRTEEVPAAIAAALGWSGVRVGLEDVVSALAADAALLVLDNAEHLPGLAGAVERLLVGCPRLHLIVTSRRPLELAGERLFPLEPLDRDAAVEMLLSRVRDRRPLFEPTAGQRADMEAIVDRLGGLPLALELAAARLPALSTRGMLTLLDQQLDLLAHPAPGSVPERQRTMRAAIEWSFQLLEPADAVVLEALSVFPAGAPLGALARVAGRAELDTIASVSHLVDQSLVRIEGDAEPRYRMLEPIRQLAAERVLQRGAQGVAIRRLRGWYLSVARETLGRPERLIRIMQGQTANVLRALTDVSGDDVPEAVELTRAVRGWIFVNHGTTELLDPLVEQWRTAVARADLATQVRMQLLDYERGLCSAEQMSKTIELAARAGSLRLELDARLALGWLLFEQRDFDRALAEMDVTVQKPDLEFAYWFDASAAIYADRLGDATADSRWQKAEHTALACGDRAVLVHLRYNQSDREMDGGRYERALDLVRAALDLDFEWTLYPRTLLLLEHRAASAEALLGRPREAAQHLQPVLLLFDRVGAADHEFPLWTALVVACTALVEHGRPDAAAPLWAFVEGDVHADPFDIHAVAAQTQLIRTALSGRPVDEAIGLVDRQQAVQYALDRIAEILQGDRSQHGASAVPR